MTLDSTLAGIVAELQEDDSKMDHTNPIVGSNQDLEIRNRVTATQAFEQILAGDFQALYKQAYRLLRNRADAEDAVQDALLAAYTHLDQFKGQARLSSWVTAIVLNSARMQLRMRLRHMHIPLDEPIGEIQTVSLSERLSDGRPTPEDEYRNAELSTRIGRLQHRLSPTLRRTFELRAIDGLSINETAQILEVPHGTVKAQFARARKRLRELMRHALKPSSCGPRDGFYRLKIHRITSRHQAFYSGGEVK